jgi:cyclopropane-fatty-acyl-phospholipid synthase
MIEAVGPEYLHTFFRKCRSLLKDDGLMCIQAITIADQRYEQARRSVDFIQRYVFPGGCLTSLTSMTASITSNTDMRVTHVEDFGPDYARTLEEWRARFFAQIGDIRDLGYGEEFLRMWEYYLCYCEGAFIERAIGVVQMLVVPPVARRRPILGTLED